jgi:FkbM family methyltransferase
MSTVKSAGRYLKNGLSFLGTIAHGYRSQYGQDRWVIEEMFHGMHDGFFVDIGASDGWTGSNTFVLEKKYGWNGICVEPNDRFFTKLKRNRRCTLINKCIADTEKEVKFLEAAGTWGGITDSYPPSHEKELTAYFPSRNIITDAGAYNTVTKHAVTLEDVLRKNNAPTVIDYLSIDAECSEYLILKDFPFDAYTLLTLTVEHSSTLSTAPQLKALLEKNGYILAREEVCDSFYYHPKFKELIGK